MLGMSNEASLLADAVIAIVALIVLITRLKVLQDVDGDGDAPFGRGNHLYHDPSRIRLASRRATCPIT